MPSDLERARHEPEIVDARHTVDGGLRVWRTDERIGRYVDLRRAIERPRRARVTACAGGACDARL